MSRPTVRWADRPTDWPTALSLSRRFYRPLTRFCRPAELFDPDDSSNESLADSDEEPGAAPSADCHAEPETEARPEGAVEPEGAVATAAAEALASAQEAAAAAAGADIN